MKATDATAPEMDRTKQARRATLRVISIYVVVSSLWILLSDQAVAQLFRDPAEIAVISTLKGWLFIAVTSLLLYVLLRKQFSQMQAISLRERVAQQGSADSQELLNAIADSSSDAIYAKDLEGRHLLFNWEAGRLLNKSPREVIGCDNTALFPSAQAEVIRANDRHVIAQKKIHTFEETLSTVDGERTYQSVKGPLIDGNGAVIGVFGISRDITERKLIEAALLDRDFKLNAIVAHSPSALSLKQPDGRYALANPNFQRIHHLTEAEIVGKTDFDLYPEEAARRFKANDELVLRTMARHAIEETMTVDGQPKTFLSHMFPVPDAAGAARFICRISLDITERKQAEAARAAALAEAERLAGIKNAFLANMSHEMRTPLNVIIGLGHLLRRDITDGNQQQRLVQLCATSDHLLATINDILDLSKIEADRLPLNISHFRIDAVVERVVRMMEGVAQEKGLALKTDVAPTVRRVPLMGDPLRLAQILINLCSNAVKFTEQGGVRLIVVYTGEDAQGVGVHFAVEDSGIGIEPTEQARLFEPFTQADDSLSRAQGGTGLGLAISQRLVALMGGTLRVDSQPGSGSTFSFELKLPHGIASEAEASTAPAAWPTTDFCGRQGLFAEDHPQSQEILFEMLEDLGCEVDVASNGAEAVECAQRRRYDMILMDMQMPKMDGLAATRAIRALPGFRDTPIVALTANAFAEDRERCLAAGMNDHLAKPVTPSSLAATLGQWLPDMVAPKEETTSCDTPLRRALAGIQGLQVGPVWQHSPERAVEYCAQLKRFVQAHGQDMELIRTHLANGDRDAAHVVAHNLKGIAGLLGAQQISTLVSEIVLELRAEADVAVILQQVALCEAELSRLAREVSALPD